MMSGKKIFVGPCEIAGYYRNLCEGFRQLGVPYDFITYYDHPFAYGGETRSPTLLRLAKWFRRSFAKPERSWGFRLLGTVPFVVLTQFWGMLAIFNYDIFIFGFGQTLLRGNRDLLILQKLGKTVITNLGLGSEARPPYVDGGYLLFQRETIPVPALQRFTRRTNRLVKRHELYSNIVIGAPYSTTQFSTRRMINSFALGLPFNSIQTSEDDARQNLSNIELSREVRILHSPSNPEAKGSPQIIRAIERLKARGYAIDFVFIHGRPFQEVMAEIQRCDFVVDQLYSDTPMAGFATESAWFGKPAIVGGYGLARLQSYVPDGMWPPTKTCHPDRVEQAIEDLILDVEQRCRLGRDAQKFVREKWSSIMVAKRYLRLIEGDIPAAWWLEPDSVIYLEGAGQTEAQTRKKVLSLVNAYGPVSLELEHRPELRDAFLEFAGITRDGQADA